MWTAGWWTPQAAGAIDPGSYAGPLSIVNPQVTAWFATQQVLPEELSIERRTLEDVFLDLTGRELRT